MKICLLRLNGIGDFILSIPACRAIRQAYPKAHISVYVLPFTADLARACPYFNEIRVFDILEWGTHFTWPHEYLRKFFTYFRFSSWFGIFRLLRLMRSEKYDLLFNFSHATKLSPLIAAFSGARDRVGFDSGPFRFFLTRRVAPPVGLHELEKNMYLLKSLNIASDDLRLEVWFSREDERAAADRVRDGGEFVPPIVVHIGAGTPAKRWTRDAYVSLLKKIPGVSQAPIVMVGGHHDRDLAGEILEEVPNQVINLVGELTILQTCALLSRCRVFVGCDSGPGHLAAAVGAPVVSLFSAASSVEAWKPWGERVRVLTRRPSCSPCHSHVCLRRDGYFCMGDIKPEEALEAVLHFLGKE